MYLLKLICFTLISTFHVSKITPVMTIETSEPDKNADEHKDESPNVKEITEKVINY